MKDLNLLRLDNRLLLQRLKTLQLKLDRSEGRITPGQYAMLLPIQEHLRRQIITERYRYLIQKYRTVAIATSTTQTMDPI
jgi:hypothetical protein